MADLHALLNRVIARQNALNADTIPVTVVGGAVAHVVEITGSNVVEVLTDADAVGNDLTFAADINSLEIWHDEATAQSFIVNGLTLVIGPGGWRSPIGGTPALTVTIPVITCVVSRLA